MNDPALVRVFEPRGDLERDLLRLVGGDRSVGDPLVEPLSGDKLHREESHPSRLVEPVDGGDVRVVQRGQDLRLPIEPREPLRVGADAWLVGHGSHVEVAGLPLGIVPLALTAALALVAFRTGRWSARTAVPVTDDRTLVGGVATFACSYVVVGVVTVVLASVPEASISISRALLGCLLLATLAGGLGLAVGTGRLETWLEPVPGWVREVVLGGLVGALAYIVAGCTIGAYVLWLRLLLRTSATAAASQTRSARSWSNTRG